MTASKTHIGPNVKRLMIERAAQLHVDAVKSKYGATGLGEMVASIAESNGEILSDTMREARDWTRIALDAIRQSPDAHRYPTDEDAAGEVLRLVALRQAKKS